MVKFDVFEESFNVNFLFPSIFPCTQVKQHWNVLFYLTLTSNPEFSQPVFHIICPRILTCGLMIRSFICMLYQWAVKLTQLTAFSFLFCLIILLSTFARDCPSLSNRYAGTAPSGTFWLSFVFVWRSSCILSLLIIKVIKITSKNHTIYIRIWQRTTSSTKHVIYEDPLTSFSSVFFQGGAFHYTSWPCQREKTISNFEKGQQHTSSGLKFAVFCVYSNEWCC